MTPRRTPEALARLVVPLRRLGVLLVGAGGLAGVLLALAVPAWLARLGVVRSPLWVVVAWVAAAVAAAGAVAMARRVWRHFSDTTVALAVEQSPGWRRGAVTALLEAPSAGTSAQLLEAADQACASALGERGAAIAAPPRACAA